MARKDQSYHDLSAEELSALARDMMKEVFEMRCELATTRKLDKPHLLKQRKKERARVLTALRQKGS